MNWPAGERGGKNAANTSSYRNTRTNSSNCRAWSSTSPSGG
jgi:hypothetical protein